MQNVIKCKSDINKKSITTIIPAKQEYVQSESKYNNIRSNNSTLDKLNITEQLESKIAIIDTLRCHTLNQSSDSVNLKVHIKTKLSKGDIYLINEIPAGIVLDSSTVIISGMIDLEDIGWNLEPNLEYYYQTDSKSISIAFSNNKLGYVTSNRKLILTW